MKLPIEVALEDTVDAVVKVGALRQTAEAAVAVKEDLVNIADAVGTTATKLTATEAVLPKGIFRFLTFKKGKKAKF